MYLSSSIFKKKYIEKIGYKITKCQQIKQFNDSSFISTTNNDFLKCYSMNTNNSQEQNKDLELYLRLRSDIKSAMKNKDQLKLNVVKSILSDLTYVSKKVSQPSSLTTSPPTNQQIYKIINKSVKTHNESIEKFSQAQRLDLVRKEQIELEILESYLPKKKLSEEEIESNIIKFIKDNNLTGNSTNLGKIMKEIKFGDSHDEILVDKKIVSIIALKVLKNMN
nr:13916_t:CDS:2 [Entrophospora candida]